MSMEHVIRTDDASRQPEVPKCNLRLCMLLLSLMRYTFILASFAKIKLENLHMMLLVQPVQSVMQLTS